VDDGVPLAWPVPVQPLAEHRFPDTGRPESAMTRPTFVSLCGQTIERVATQYWLQPQECDDFTQDAWLDILTSLARGRYDPHRGRLENWLYVVVRNCAISFRRRRRRDAQGEEQFPLELLPGSAAEDPCQRLDRMGRIEAVRSAVELLAQRLSPTSYAVFHLRHVEQASIAEVSVQLGLTPGQVRVYDHRARRKLAAILAHRGWPGTEFSA
jgi:RNA polymerase sigma factor (sigma-70 family)